MTSSFFKAANCCVFFLFIFVGCREYHYYQYKPTKREVLGGQLLVELIGTQGDKYTDRGQDKAEFGAPYRLQFTFKMPKEIGLSEIEVSEITFTGLKTRETISIPSTQSYRVQNLSSAGGGYVALASVGGLSRNTLAYENYKVQFNLTVRNDETGLNKEESILVLLSTNYEKHRRSDFLDQFMGWR